MNVTIREYQSSDFEACCILEDELAKHHADIYNDPSISETDSREIFTEYLSRTDRCGTWVVEAEGTILGFTGLIDTVGEVGTAEIEPVVITSTARGAGIGTELIQYVKEEAKKKDFRFLTIRPVLRNNEAFKLYVNLGFNHIGSIELFQDLDTDSKRTWKSGITVHGMDLMY